MTVKQLRIYIGILLFALVSGCEKDITLDLPKGEDKLVVEGHIEQGSFPYVLLTRNTSFFGGASFTDYFIHNAVVHITNKGADYLLTEYCIDNLPDPLKPLVYAFLGISEQEAAQLDLCAYFNFNVTGQIGEKYVLKITSGNKSVQALTTIPPLPEIDSLWVEPHELYGDSLVYLWGRFIDPDTLGNYYRFFTKTNSEPFYPGYFSSVTDDLFVNGKMFNSTIDKGQSRNAEINFETYGLFRKGDTVILNVSMIDKAHYWFWNSLEEQINNGGPYASPTYLQSNVDGGLGIWGGYGAAYDTIVIPK